MKLEVEEIRQTDDEDDGSVIKPIKHEDLKV